jgi:hypothetical protein
MSIFDQRNVGCYRHSHRLVCLGFGFACAELPGSGGDALGVSSEDARAEDSAVCGLLRGVYHAVFVFIEGVWLGLAV